MAQTIEINEGEILVKFTSPTAEKVSFKDLGIKDEELYVESGFLRVVFDLEGIGPHDYYKVPTIELSYKENTTETHWQCDFNEEQILDKYDHHGNSTVILLNRDKMESLEHHHENKLILHADLPEPLHIIAKDSYINLFK